MAQNWEIDPKTGDYVMEGGSPKQTDSLRIPAYLRIKTKRREWLYAPDEQYGSEFHKVKKRKTSQDATMIENIAADALSPIVDDGRASEIEISTSVVVRHGIGLETKITDARGEVEQLLLPSI